MNFRITLKFKNITKEELFDESLLRSNCLNDSDRNSVKSEIFESCDAWIYSKFIRFFVERDYNFRLSMYRTRDTKVLNWTILSDTLWDKRDERYEHREILFFSNDDIKNNVSNSISANFRHASDQKKTWFERFFSNASKESLMWIMRFIFTTWLSWKIFIVSTWMICLWMSWTTMKNSTTTSKNRTTRNARIIIRITTWIVTWTSIQNQLMNLETSRRLKMWRWKNFICIE